MISEQEAEKATIIKVLAGSHIHGLNVETSDRDEEAIVIEPLAEAMGLEKPFEEKIVETPEKDIKWVSLRKWCHLALKGNPNFLLPLFAPHSHILRIDARGSMLRDMAASFISKQTVKSHLGYMQGQRSRLLNHQRSSEEGLSEKDISKRFGAGGGRGKPRFELIDKFGYDTKFGMHLLRLGHQGCEILATGKLTLPIPEPMHSLLMDVRAGKEPLSFVLEQADLLEKTMKEMVDGSSLPDKPDYEEVEKWMLMCYIRLWTAQRRHEDMIEDLKRLGKPTSLKELGIDV